MRGVGRRRRRAALGIIGLVLLAAGPARAVTQGYTVDPGSFYTPAGGQPETLTGGFELSLVVWLCDPIPGEQSPCAAWYDVGALSFTSDGLDLDLAPPQPIPGLFEFSLADLRVQLPGPPSVEGLVVERSTLPPQAPQEQRFRDLVLRTSGAGVPDNQLVLQPGNAFLFPSDVSLDLELVEILRVVVFDGAGDHVRTLSTTVLGSLSLGATPVPEPASALLLGGGLALLTVSSRRRAIGS